MFQQMLDVYGRSLVSPGWLVLSVMVGMCDIQTLTTRYYNVVPDFFRPTHIPWTFDLTKRHDFGQSAVLHSRNITEPPEPLAFPPGVH